MSGPRLLLLDLDNTLIDRAALFRGWAQDFAARHGLDPREVAWLEERDGDGLVPKQAFFAQVIERHGLDGTPERFEREYHERYPAFTVPPAASTLAALADARARGWRLGIVTNGPPMQEAVVDHAGLRPLVDDVCVSATVGLRKPDPAIFDLAAERCGARAAGNWMIGDSAVHDVAGGAAAGMHTVWLRRGRDWREREIAPTRTAGDVAQAIAMAVSAEPAA